MIDEGKKYSMFRIYGHNEVSVFDEYWEGLNAQHAVDRFREWHEDYDFGCGPYIVEEVAKVVKGWK